VGQRPVALVVHPPQKGKYRDELIHLAGLPADRVFDGSLLNDGQTMDAIRNLGPDLGLSVFFDFILKPAFFETLQRGCLNLHPAYLPYNRGQYPNVWSIVEGTPSGVTLHYIDSGIDTGDIVAQREVPIAATDTGETLYRKLEDACVALFKETWPGVVSGTAPRRPQPRQGTSHRTADVGQIDRIQLDREYTARYLIDVLRARTFPPHESAYFVENGRRPPALQRRRPDRSRWERAVASSQDPRAGLRARAVRDWRSPRRG
jgi:methionyl-tRNA formyltransferase